jgi:alpha,alpha-trehalase
LKKSFNISQNIEVEDYSWTIVYERFEPAEESLRESLCTLGNGYFATRGAAPEAVASRIHYPGTYINGAYNRLRTNIAGRAIVNEDLVNCPNWIFLTFKIGNGEWFYPSHSRILSFRQKLDMRYGVLNRKIRFQNRKSQRTCVEMNRIVSMADPHCGAFEYIITAENYSEPITVRTMLDGTVLNTGVERYRQLNSKHWKPLSLGSFDKNGIFLHMKTSQSGIEIAEAAKTRLFVGNKEIRPKIKRLMKGKERIGQEFHFFARKNCRYRIEKTVVIYTSNDQDTNRPLASAKEALQKSRRFKYLFKTHQEAWVKLWDRCDIKIQGDSFSQRALRFHIFHLLQTASLHNVKIDAGLPARGLHGEAYRGHIFWDGIFTMPFYNLYFPEVAKSLILYRYRRLAKAREYAKKEGYQGAMFPWQSGSSGREETQIVHLNPLSGKWGPDYSRYQRHVSFAIAYNIWQYYKTTGDFGFLVRYGAELILSIARFGASLAKYDPVDNRYHTKGIMGPDEFHEKYPNLNKAGLKDNAYTNLMIVWTLLRAQEIIRILPEGHKKRIAKKIKLEQKELTLWDDITHRMKVVLNNSGIISQFDGYFKLRELDWKGYKLEYGNIQRMDRILKAEGKFPDSYKVSKQADVLMVFYLLSLEEVEGILKRLGYKFDKNILRKNYEYYLKRTSHGSTLSWVVHCFIAQLLAKPKETWRMFLDVLKSDIYDLQNGTVSEGIHVGAMGGSLDIVIRGFAGINTLDDKVVIEPRLPKNWQNLKMNFIYKGVRFSLTITKHQVSVIQQGPITIPVEIFKRLYYPCLGKVLKVPIL